MEDSIIIQLYWAREERALAETESKYGGYCRAIACNILNNREDAEECVNDTYLRAWNAMPPQRPSILGAFLGKITRNLSLDRIKIIRAEKRGGGQIDLALDELGDCIPDGDGESLEQRIEAEELARCLDRFLRDLPERECCVFLRRYWYVDSVQEIAHRYHMAEGSVKSTLFRVRKKLRVHLEKEGVAV